MDELVALRNLPGRLHTYDTTVIEGDSLNDEQCLLCWRNFNSDDDDDKNDDDKNANKTPCKPVRLESCGHIIGDQCLQRLIDHGVRDCQMCKCPIQRLVSSQGLPSWLIRQVEIPNYKHSM